MKKNYFASIIMAAVFLLFLPTVNAQNSTTVSPTKVVEMKLIDVSKPMSEVQNFNKKRSILESKVINNKIDFREDPNMDRKWVGTDPVIQNHINALRSGAPNTVEQVLTGVSNDDNEAINGFKVAPPDTQGDVGLNHYVQMTNLLTIIYNKDGSVALGPFPNSNFWTGAVIDGIDFSNENSGDPIVLYDEYEDRWIVSHFSTTYNYVLFAVSVTGDPTGAYYRYGMAFPNFPDYPKFGIWDDGIYFTVNEFSGNYFVGSSLVGIEKAGLYDGTGANGFYLFLDTNTYPDYGSWLPADADGPTPPPNSTHYTLSRSYGQANTMHLITTEPDWVTIANTVITISDFTVDPYFTSSTISNAQPNGQYLSSLGDRLMYRLQYRNFGTHQAMVVNHSVQNSVGGPFGVRWYELRAASGDHTWSTYQSGTFLPSDGENRWMGSIAMNGAGEIALGYSVSSSSTHPSIRFSGQSAGASGTGVLDLPETSIFTGTVSQSGIYRWGDYSMMSVDPSNDNTFWYTTEHGATGNYGWATEIAEITLGAPQDPAMIAVTPPSFTFTVAPDATDSDLLSIANTGLAGANDLTWSISYAVPPPPASPGNENMQTAIRSLNGASLNINTKSNREVSLNGGEFFAFEAIDPLQESGKATVVLDPNYFPNSASRSANLLYDNGNLINSPGTGVGGTDESVLQNTSLGMTIIGFGHQFSANYSVAEDFTISDPDGWQVDEFVFYAYQSFAGNASTITGIYYEIWDGDPSDPVSNIIFGDLFTNRLVSSSWTNIYRVTETTSGSNSDRAIMESTASAGVVLGSGTYWIVWQTDGSAASGPWAPPITINGQATTGNAKQSLNGGVWADVLDAGSATAQGLPFLIKGSLAVPPCPWLSVTPEFGTLVAGTNEDLTVTVDATGLAEGTYECELIISSNAVNDPLVTVPVTLIVADCEAPTVNTKDITVELDENGQASIVALDILEPTTFADLTSTANWNGYVGVFVDEDFVAGDITALGDVKSTIDVAADEITLQPNFNPYYPDNFDNPVLQGSTYIEEFGTLAGGASFIFTGNTTSNTLDSRYEAFAFIRIFNTAFEFLGEIRDPLVAGNDFSVQYNNTEPDAYIFQYGFTVEGTSGAGIDEASLGNAVVQGMTLNIAPYSSCGLESVVISQTDFDCNDVGTNEVTITATDINGEVSTGTAEVTVEDNELPVLTVISTPISLWPPNHKYETIDMSQLVISVDDNCGDLSMNDVYITSVSSDEEEDANGNGDGKTVNDIVINTDCNSVDLRKERSGNGNGRVYTISLAVDDGNGNIGTAKCEVHVPHNNGETAIDDGIAYLEECGAKSSFVAFAEDDIHLTNYPNPFNGSTTITFTLTETENTILKVYDTFGKEVSTLFDGIAESGKQYRLDFKGENLSKGIYVYHLKSGNNVSVVKKMILIK